MRHSSYPEPSSRGRSIERVALALAVALALLLPVTAASAQSATPEVTDARPYDDKLNRLAEVLGAVHFLRELCGANEGQTWRERMRELIDTDKGSALRRVKLTKSFNHGYRSYRRTYQTCSTPAQATLTKFMTEGAELSDLILRETQ